MKKQIKKEITAPNVIHSERGNGFHEFFKEQCKKVEHSQLRVQVVSSPLILSQEYLTNYDAINWNSVNSQPKKLL